MDVAGVPTELHDRWLLPYRGSRVAQIRVSHQLTLLLDSGAQVEIECEAMLSHGPRSAPDTTTTQLVPERQEIVPALSLFNATILSSVAFKSGALRLTFDTGAHLNVDPDPRYEAWSAQGPGDLLFVCQPGGEIAIWL